MYEQDTPDHYYLGQNFSALQSKHGINFVKDAVDICEHIANTDLVTGVEIIAELLLAARTDAISKLIAEGRLK